MSSVYSPPVHEDVELLNVPEIHGCLWKKSTSFVENSKSHVSIGEKVFGHMTYRMVPYILVYL
jgi:hypothetical protein